MLLITKFTTTNLVKDNETEVHFGIVNSFLDYALLQP